jgi:hypothetical protein
MPRCARAPVPSRQRVLFNRHSLASGDTATAMLWLDVKRVYLELRPHLRRLYTPVPDVDRALTVLAPLGFAALPGAPVQIGEDTRWTLVNDFGPGSIDGWLSEVVGRELAAEEPTVLDAAARRLVLDGRSIGLSRLSWTSCFTCSVATASRSLARSCCARCGDTSGRAQAQTSSRRSSAGCAGRWAIVPARSRRSAGWATDSVRSIERARVALRLPHTTRAGSGGAEVER